MVDAKGAPSFSAREGAPPAASMASSRATSKWCMRPLKHTDVFIVNALRKQTCVSLLRDSYTMGAPQLLKDRLRLARLKRGYSSGKKLAVAAGVSASAVTNLEAGLRSSGPAALIALAATLRVRLDWLMDGAGPEPNWEDPTGGPEHLPPDAYAVAAQFNAVHGPLRPRLFALLQNAIAMAVAMEGAPPPSPETTPAPASRKSPH